MSNISNSATRKLRIVKFMDELLDVWDVPKEILFINTRAFIHQKIYEAPEEKISLTVGIAKEFVKEVR